MQAYAGNLAASVTRALGTVYPTVYSLLGADDFDPLAQLYSAQHPPRCGDWAQYGAQFPSWLTQHNPGGVTDALPYLPDIAHMDYAIFGCENSANQTVDRDSLALLTQDANTLRLVLQTHVKWVSSLYDIDSIVQGQPQSRNLTSQTPQTVCIWRDGWRAQTQRLSPDQHQFLNACSAGQTLAHAHALALTANPGFDFAVWLVQALSQNLILHIERTPHGQDTDNP
jgi:hypothetical protein